MREIRYFHICARGNCRQPGLYQTKQGESYCSKCAIKYIYNYGIKDFWPHGLEELIDLYNNSVIVQEIRDKEESVKEMWEEAEKKVIKKGRSRKK